MNLDPKFYFACAGEELEAMSIDKLYSILFLRIKCLVDIYRECDEYNEVQIQQDNNFGWVGIESLNDDTDSISHFILRLAVSTLFDLASINFFVKSETLLFSKRLELCTTKKREEFIECHIRRLFPNLKSIASLPFASREEMEIIPDILEYQNSSVATRYLLIPFENAIPLYADRRVFLKNGFAYVPYPSLIPPLLTFHFQLNLEKKLQSLSRGLPQIIFEEDLRLQSLLKSVGQTLLFVTSFKDLATTTSMHMPHVTATSVSKISKYFPPCIWKLHENLRQKSHLYFVSRDQYALFLKSIGASMTTVQQIFREGFKTLSDEEYNRNRYDYRIRWLYGKEGMRCERSLCSCDEIISNPEQHGAAGDLIAGCLFTDRFGYDFRRTTILQITDAYQKSNIDVDGFLPDIEDLVTKGSSRLACRKVFNAIHEQNIDIKRSVTNSECFRTPNDWYQRLVSSKIQSNE